MEGFIQRPAAASLEELELQRPLVDRVVRPLLRGMASSIRSVISSTGRLLPQGGLEKIQRDLLLAGNPWHLSAIDFVGLRVIVALLLGAIGIFTTVNTPFPPLQILLIGGGLMLSGSSLPTYWLKGRVKSRQDEIRKALPDALDMLTITVDAGLPFDLAMSRIADKWENALAVEFSRVVAEMRMGMQRQEALRRMADRTGGDDVSNFVAVLIQSDRLGVSISQVLHAQSDQLRTRRRQRAEQLANEAPVKMVFPLVLFMLPALFAILLGPAVPEMLKSFGALQGP